MGVSDSSVYIFLVLGLILSSQFKGSSGCIKLHDSHTHDETTTSAFHAPLLDESLYDGDSVEEFINLCPNEPKNKYPLLKDLFKPVPSILENPSDCRHSVDTTRNYKEVEIFFLQQAQNKLRTQRAYLNSISRGFITCVLFLIPLGMTIYLVIVGHFDYRTLPIIGLFLNFKLVSDKTSGQIYTQLKFMKFNLRPKSHWSFKGLNKANYSWLEYFKWDHLFQGKALTTFKKFKFLDLAHVSRYLGDDEVNNRKRNLLLQGWGEILTDDMFVSDTLKSNTETGDGGQADGQPGDSNTSHIVPLQGSS